MQTASDMRAGGMVAITGVDEDSVLRLIAESTEIAAPEDFAEASSSTTPFLAIGNYLGEKNFAVSGDMAACKVLREAALQEAGVKVARLLAVSGAFHSPLMLPAQQTLAAVLENTPLTPEAMSCPVYSNVTGDTFYYHHSTPTDIKAALLNQLIQPVLWDKSMSLLLSSPSFQSAYEIGPGTVCSGIVKMYNRRAKVKYIKL